MTTDDVGPLVDRLAAVADHRYTLLAGWLSPVAVVVLAPEDMTGPLFGVLFGVFTVLHAAQTAGGPDL